MSPTGLLVTKENLHQNQPLRRMPMHGTRHDPHLRRGLLLLVLAICSFLAVSCVPFLAGKKDTPTTSVASDRPVSRTQENTVKATEATTAAEKSEPPRSRSDAVEDEFTDRTEASPSAGKLRDRPPLTGKSDDTKRSEEEAEKGPSGRDRRVPEWAQKLFKSESADQKASAADASKTPGNREVRFEKFDHAKYVKKIKNSALDILNKDSACNLARICSDSITNDWWLTLYRKSDRTYSFTTYIWDAVDGKWEESFVSGKEPLSKLSHHIRSSSSGKYCEVLKGKLGPELEASDEMARKTAPRKRRPGR